MNLRELLARRAEVIDQLRAIVEAAEGENRDLTQEEAQEYNDLFKEAEALKRRIDRLQNMPESPDHDTRDHVPDDREIGEDRQRIENEARAVASFARAGDYRAGRDVGGWDASDGEIEIPIPRGLDMIEARAVDSTMNITTSADGGYTVPTGFSGRVAARRNEVRLAERLGVLQVPGRGTTVNYPFENADPAVFAATSEQDDAHAQTYERDTPVFGIKAFTLAKKTKKLELTEELLDDEDVGIMGFIADHIGRAIGNTHNSLLLTEVAANGSTLKTYASATAIAAGEPEDIVFNDTLGFYLMDDGMMPAWVMRSSTFGNIASITGNSRLYAETPGGSFMREILGYPVYYSNNAAATEASAKDAYFGRWDNVGMREGPALRLIRDIYSVDGLVILKYSFRTVYGVLIAGAIGFGVHPTG